MDGILSKRSAVFLGKVFGGITAIWVGSELALPLKPVPMSLQTLALFLMGMLYVPREVFFTVGGYLLLGLLGAPIFANGSSGLSAFLGPTGGFLLGFLAFTMTMAFLRQRWQVRTFFPFLYLGFLGTVILFAFGLIQLGIVKGFTIEWLCGFLYPFLMFNFIKLTFAALLATLLSEKKPWKDRGLLGKA